MQTAGTHPGTLEIRGLALRQLLTVGGRALALFIFAIAVFLAARRAIGAFTEPLPTLLLVATALVMLTSLWLVSSVVRRAKVDAKLAANRTERWVLHYLPWLSLLAAAYACSYPGRRFIDWLVWSMAIAVAWLGPRCLTRLGSIRSERPAAADTPGLSTAGVAPTDEQLLQQLTRCRTADGSDVIRGTLVAEFAPGQRTATLYVAFCPPFERLPQIEAEIDEADLATIKLTQVLHNGAQLEVRLSRASTLRQAIAIELYAAQPHAA